MKIQFRLNLSIFSIHYTSLIISHDFRKNYRSAERAQGQPSRPAISCSDKSLIHELKSCLKIHT